MLSLFVMLRRQITRVNSEKAHTFQMEETQCFTEQFIATKGTTICSNDLQATGV